MVLGIVELYQGGSGKKGFYNSQEIGLARAMKKLGYKTVIFYPNSTISLVQEETVEEEILVVTCPAKNIGVHSVYDWDVLLRYGVEIVQLDGDNQIASPNVLKFCDQHKIPAYCFLGTVRSDTASGLKKLVMDCLIRRNIKAYKHRKCFVKTRSVKSQLAAQGVRDIEVAPVGLDISVIPTVPESRGQLREEVGISTSTTVLLFVGRMDEYKRPFELVSLMQHFQGKDVCAIVIGTGSLDNAFDERVLNAGLENQIKRVKRIPNAEIHKYYKLADYYLNFNQVEIFGMSILEAMYQGCTVIANHAPGPDFIVENGKNGYLVDDTNQMREIIDSLQSPGKDAIIERIRQNFLWSSTAEKMHRWITETVSTDKV